MLQNFTLKTPTISYRMKPKKMKELKVKQQKF